MVCNYETHLLSAQDGWYALKGSHSFTCHQHVYPRRLQSAVFRICSVSRTLRRGSSQWPRRAHALPLLEQLNWLPVRPQIKYKLAVLTFKIRRSSTPAYLARHIRSRQISRRLHSSNTPLLHKPTTRTHFANHAFCGTAPTIWNSLSNDVVSSTSLAVFKSTLRTFLFRQTFRPSRFSRL